MGVLTTYSNDNRGLQTSITDALGNTRTTSYDAVGRTATEVDARGNTTTFSIMAGMWSSATGRQPSTFSQIMSPSWRLMSVMKWIDYSLSDRRRRNCAHGL